MNRIILQDSPRPWRPRPSPATWTVEEDAVLWQAVTDSSGKMWKSNEVVAAILPGRTKAQCLHRWQTVLRPGLVKGPWSREEDAKLRYIVRKSIDQKTSINWSVVARRLMELRRPAVAWRSAQQCRERWRNRHFDLAPNNKRSEWTEQEDRRILDCHAKVGNSWTAISKVLEGRTISAIKNRWNTTLKHVAEKEAIVSKDDDCKSQTSSPGEQVQVVSPAPAEDIKLLEKCSKFAGTGSSERQTDATDVEPAHLWRAISYSTHGTSDQRSCNDSSFEQRPVQQDVINQTARHQALMTLIHSIVLTKVAKRNLMMFKNGSRPIKKRKFKQLTSPNAHKTPKKTAKSHMLKPSH